MISPIAQESRPRTRPVVGGGILARVLGLLAVSAASCFCAATEGHSNAANQADLSLNRSMAVLIAHGPGQPPVSLNRSHSTNTFTAGQTQSTGQTPRDAMLICFASGMGMLRCSESPAIPCLSLTTQTEESRSSGFIP